MGFVYVITNTLNGRKYIGKKLVLHKRTTQKTVKLKNGDKRKKKIRSLVESDWRDYWGSSNELASDIEKFGREHFTREIIHLCHSRAMCTYMELREQIDRRVLESQEYYNGHIQARVHKSHIKIPK